MSETKILDLDMCWLSFEFGNKSKGGNEIGWTEILGNRIFTKKARWKSELRTLENGMVFVQKRN